MVLYHLPKAINLGGKDYPIRYDTVAALDCIQALTDPDLDNDDKAEALLFILYKDKIPRRYQKEAITKAFEYLDGGKQPSRTKSPRVVDWEQDFAIICPAVNRVLGYDARENPEALHWWTFLGAYNEIGGDCPFATLVSIRDKKARGKKLEKWEKEFCQRNPELVNIKERLSKAEQAEQDEINKLLHIHD